MAKKPVILAAGGVLLRKASWGDEVMVVYRKHYRDWSLPKGKLEKGESFRDAAVREMREETGCKVRVEKFLGAIAYEVKARPKVILYWRMSLVRQTPLDNLDGEVARAEWMKIPEAIERLTYADEREFLLKHCRPGGS